MPPSAPSTFKNTFCDSDIEETVASAVDAACGIIDEVTRMRSSRSFVAVNGVRTVSSMGVRTISPIDPKDYRRVKGERGRHYSGDGMIITGSGFSVRGNYLTLIGNDNSATGSIITMKGDRCKLSGNQCKLIGHKSEVSGNMCDVQGNDNRVSGNMCTVRGLRCKVSGNMCSYKDLEPNSALFSDCQYPEAEELEEEPRKNAPEKPKAAPSRPTRKAAERAIVATRKELERNPDGRKKDVEEDAYDGNYDREPEESDEEPSADDEASDDAASEADAEDEDDE